MKYLSILVLFFSMSTLADQHAEVGKAAPDFSLMNTQGKKVALKDFKGKLVVLEWLNHGCPYVKKHYNSGNMQKLQKEYTDKDVVWLSVVSSAPGKQGFYKGNEAEKITKEKKAVPTHYLMDPDGSVGQAYGAKTTPHMYVVNKEGTLVYAGAIDDKPSTDEEDVATAKNYVSAALNAVMAGKKVALASSQPYGCSVKYKN